MNTQNIVIIGSGIVGQATGFGFNRLGHTITFCDIDKEKLETLSQKGFQICKENELGNSPDSTMFFLSICTPTVKGKINLHYLQNATTNLGQALRKIGGFPVITVRSTVPPGTTKNVIIPILEEQSGKKAGRDFGVTMNPEYLRQNRNEEDFQNPWIVLIGELNKKSGDLLERVYGDVKCPVHRFSIEQAEAQKYIHNIWNATKISFFNEFRRVLTELGIDSDIIFPTVVKSAEASFNPEYGIKNLGPFGGACLPKDTSAFLTFARSKGIEMPLLGAVIGINNSIQKETVPQNKDKEDLLALS